MAGTRSAETADQPAGRRHRALRFGRYASMSLITVPAGYALLLWARSRWDVNAGLLNLAVGTVLTPPSFLLYRTFVWPASERGGTWRALFSFWQTVMVGALGASACIAVADHLLPGRPALIVAAGLAGQGLIFLARFVWLDLVTFADRRR